MSAAETVIREKLVSQSKAEFQRAGYSLWSEVPKSNVFDFIAKKTDTRQINFNQQRIITKVVVDLDFFKKQTSIELQLISKLISGFPLLIALYADRKNIEEETLYRRHDISAVSLNTLKKYLQFEGGKKSAKISKFTSRGGVYVNLSKEKFKLQRKIKKFDMTHLAERVGISRHSLYKYEKGESFPKVDNYISLCKELDNDDLDVPLDIYETQFKGLCENTLKDYKQPRTKLQKEVGVYLAEKDFEVLWFKSKLFDGLSEPIIDKPSSIKIAKVPSPIITGVTSQNEKNDFSRLLLVNSLSKFLRKKAVWFIDDDLDDMESPEDSLHMVVINISDLEGMALIDFIELLNKK
ncbi:MAG: helix-turn-helix domain-containing protein [Candidatus Hodarchaeota archaeon]